MNHLRRYSEPFSHPSVVKSALTAQPEEVLIADQRAGLTPSDMVEQRFRMLLQDALLSVGEAAPATTAGA